MKSNDQIPADEMLLAEALAAAKARGLKWTKGVPFRTERGHECKPERAAKCCVLGALYFAGRVPLSTAAYRGGRIMRHGLFSARVWSGNDDDSYWDNCIGDCGESMGFAFRQAMETP